MAHLRFLYPARSSEHGGNATTARRISQALESRGHVCTVQQISREEAPKTILQPDDKAGAPRC